MSKKSVAVIGSSGHVGKAHVEFFSPRHHVLSYDPPAGEEPSRERVNQCDLAVICVPTPMDAVDGSCDISLIEEICEWVECRYILIKSTVPPGTTEDLAVEGGGNRRVVFSPEYIGESSYYTNWGFEKEVKKTPWFIFGEPRNRFCKGAANAIAEYYTPIAGPQAQYFFTDSTTAEVVKYWENCYFAAKVTFCNEMKRVCDAFGVDFLEARELWGADPRVEKMHTMVFPDNPGFGGKCYPKDLAAIIAAAEKKKYDPVFLKAIRECNATFRKEIRE